MKIQKRFKDEYGEPDDSLKANKSDMAVTTEVLKIPWEKVGYHQDTFPSCYLIMVTGLEASFGKLYFTG